jgi:competence protein ComEA
MLKLRRLVRDFFGFPRAHVNAFLIMLPLMTVAIFSQPLYHAWENSRPLPDDIYELKLDSMVAQLNVQQTQVPPPDFSRVPTMFHFNPNAIEQAEMKALGFSAALANRITNYRKKGGHFRIKADLLKIYGMDSSFYQRMYAYIDLPASYETVGKNHALPFPNQMTTHVDRPALKAFDLNLADTTQLKTIKGIGTKLSARIIKYRDAIGGFVDVGQLKEVYGLDTAVIGILREKAFITTEFRPRKLQINASGEKELSAHPYFSGSAAKAIVAYRFQHGDFTSVDDLRKISALKSETIQKIAPYLEFGK